ncbi:LEA14-like dessication related protein [Halogranum amylolyticum]|uniref:LEA14-like dessication related protein n=1 Tax=Halogranum amylolyticum TaxID=660520 RepID=A0A1H8SCF2_9EURY|nr:LEA type 2 family protein [Halogranum amylolyticum]SEO76719.1 LEA14-like dessication related protein [Halogranum amylolyticum]
MFEKWKVSLIGVVLLVGVVGGTVALGVVGTPSVTRVENRFGSVNETATVVESDLQVSNPNPLGVTLGGLSVDYAVSMNDVEMAHGKKASVDIERGNSTLPFATTMRVDANIHSSLVDRSFGAPQVERSVETDIISEFNSTETRPVNADAALISDPVLYVNETSARWGTVNESATPIAMEFTMYNPKSYPIPISEVGYTVTMNDITVGNGTSAQSYVVPARSERTVETRTTIENPTLDEWWVSHLEANQRTDLEIDFYAKIDVSGETVRVPLDELTYTETVETDLFGTKGETAVGAETETDGGDGATSTAATTPDADETTTTATDDEPDADGGDSPATPTATPTSTSQDDSTTTDDGGLLSDRRAPPTV